MTKHCRRWALATLPFVAIGALGTAEAWRGDDAGVVTEWNQLLQSNIPATAGLLTPRYFSMLHIAMFDAINSIERDYERYHVLVRATPVASTEAAAAQAAHDILVALIPSATATFDAALKSRLDTMHYARAAQGTAVGKKVAQAVLDWRTGDGSEQPNPPYTPPELPGLWQPAFPGQVAAFVHFSEVEPFALLTSTQYLPAPPPLLNSVEYATDVNQVKELGSADSSARTADQTLTAHLFAGVGYAPGLPFALWNNVARDVAEDEGLSLVETARLFALMNAAMHDGIQTSHSSKYVYNLWRPITAIRRADEDANDATAADPSWTPLVSTPPYPSHSSNLTCVGASAARTLSKVLRSDAIPFSLTWKGTGGNLDVTRSYASFSQLAEEGALSRVHAGVHYLFELTTSHESCRAVADYVVQHYAKPKR
jgi:hypothetical protein